MTKKVEHEHKCDTCGEVATKNIQEEWHEYDIDETGNFDEAKSWEGGDNEFYCDKCFEAEMGK